MAIISFKNGAEIAILGIRHHGPGSARNVRDFLDSFQPDCLLIEGPPDANALVGIAIEEEVIPPLAILVYNPKELSQASFYPFADFSPEWQALQYGGERGITTEFMDMPTGVGFVLEQNQVTELQFSENAHTNKKQHLDPFVHLAQIAGYSDVERWWEAAIERHQTPTDVFVVIMELMTALRQEKKRHQEENKETLLREAYMREIVRTHLQTGKQKIAIVCGAWHGPAIADVQNISASADKSALKGLKKVKTDATWVPWTFDRMSMQSGYASGVRAPAWYQLLYNYQSNASIHWMASAARLLRDHDIPTSSAHVTEAVRLADTLAILRNTTMPGIDELTESAVSILTEGADKAFELIEKQMVIGDRIGVLPSHLMTVPLRNDFEAQVKSCRLTLSSLPQKLSIDLREESGRKKSTLLHRVIILGIPWCKPDNAVSSKRFGQFHEDWILHWMPDYEIRLIEAGTLGNTVASAAAHAAQKKIAGANNLAQLVELLGHLLKAGITTVINVLLVKLQQVAALSKETLILAEAILPLVEVIRYGHARKLPLDTLETMLEGIIPRVCLQLPDACLNIQEDVANQVLKTMLSVHRALGLLQRPTYDEQWVKSLHLIASSDHSAPILSGFATRLLFDKGQLLMEDTGTRLSYHLSKAAHPLGATLWLDGFLQGNAMLIIHQEHFWDILYRWLAELPSDVFAETVPLLRRSFSAFSQPERAKLLDLAKNYRKADTTTVQQKQSEYQYSEEVKVMIDFMFGG